VTAAQLNVRVIEGPNELFFGFQHSTSADVNYLVLPLIVVLVTALLASLALPLGPLLRSMPPLRAYAIDIAGSMLGIAGFATMSFLGLPPPVWFAVLAVLLVLGALGTGLTAWSAIGGAAMLAVVATSVFAVGADKDLWSPYYRITGWGRDAQQVSLHSEDGDTPWFLSVDGIPHQAMVDSTEAEYSPLHRQVYPWYPDRPFDSTLNIGAGTGTDTALALAKGAGHVTAVEIDPQLARIGREFHPEHVYDDPRVTLIVNDGRAFLRSTDQRYDLIVFALTDSLTLVSSTGSVRLESFIFTEEAIAAARAHLTPDGVFVMYNIYREPWLVTKLGRTMEDVFGREPLVRDVFSGTAVLAAGPAVSALGGSPPNGGVDPLPEVGDPAPQPATDDWPFPYLRTPGVATYYLLALGFLLAFAIGGVLLAARATSTPIRRFSPHFFVLGVAFLLLETRSLVSFSLLFGTTWLVNALTFFAILASVLLAIAVNARVRPRNPIPMYVGLGIALVIAYIMPPDSLLLDPPGLRYALAAAVAFAPIFFANLVFTYSFKDTAVADMAFASNLLGAMVGGALEYVALLSGFRSLLLVVAGLYLLAFLLARRWRLLADRDLIETLESPTSSGEAPAYAAP
jgi:spermidine synthase